MESFDNEKLRRILRPDAFVFSPTSDGVLTSTDLVIAEIRHWFDAVAARGATIRLRTESRLAGASPSGQGVWVFDHVVADATRNEELVCSVPICLTVLLAPGEDWRIAAAYWSAPFPTKVEQDIVKHAGDLEPGRILDERVDAGTGPFVDALRAALPQPKLLPDLYSARVDAGTSS